jgi:hypothetical protein
MPVYETAAKIAQDVAKGKALFKPIDITSDRSLQFADLHRPHARQPPFVRLNANLASADIIFNKNEEHQFENHSLLVVLHDEDGDALTKLLKHGVITQPLNDKELAAEWTVKPFFKGEGYTHFFKLPVTKDGKRFKIKSNIKLIPHKENPKLYLGQAVALEATIGAWFNLDRSECGLTLRLSNLKFEDAGKLQTVEEDDADE